MNTYASFVMNILGVILGGLITFFCSKFYYKKAGKELKEAAADLHRQNFLILRGLQHAGLVTLNEDPQGNIIGFKLTLHAESGTYHLTGSEVGLHKGTTNTERR